MTESHPAPETAAAVLELARDRRGVADRAEADLLQAAVAWAAMHSVDSITEAATVSDRSFGDTAMTVAGPGAPLVSEFSCAEFAAAIGLPTEAGKAYIGEGVELRYRLARTWARVLGGDLAAWRARRVASATILLSREAAAYVDTHVAHVAHKIRIGQLDKLIDEAIARFMPDEADRRRRQAADGRGFHVNTQQAGLDGTTDVWGTLDTADALDLNTAAAGAETLKSLGSTDSLDVRRATAPDEHPADCDHIRPFDRGGTTCSCNLAPLCRRHHRLKTHGRWTYTQVERGTYLWASPHAYTYLRNHHGTLDLGQEIRSRQARPPAEHARRA